MTDPEDRIAAALDALPGPGAEATARARRSALDALPLPPAPRRSRRRRRTIALVLAGAGIAAATAGLGLAATGCLDVRIGAEAPRAAPVPRVPPGRVLVPPPLHGVAVVAGGRLWLGTRDGLRIEGLPVSAAELSPNALYAAVGIGRSLVAMAPDGRRAWVHPVEGTVVAAAWRPNPQPTLIAYVVRRGERFELRLIEGDGGGDRLIDPDVAPARPVWRADTLAVGYASASGRPRLWDVAADAARPADAPVRPAAAPPVALVPDGSRVVAIGPSGAGRLVLRLPAGLRARSVSVR
jgi:hypothetical protein